jgi:hypothetical protein
MTYKMNTFAKIYFNKLCTFKIVISIMLVLVYSCGNKDLQVSQMAVFQLKNIMLNNSRIDTLKTNTRDSLLYDNNLNQEINTAAIVEKVEFCRYEEGPSDDNINGKPLVIQMEIAQTCYIQSPDTLLFVVKQKYQSWEHFLPKSIADNFEEGISTEHIHYPELIVNFQLFENGYSKNPYSIISVKVYRDAKGVVHSVFVD